MHFKLDPFSLKWQEIGVRGIGQKEHLAVVKCQKILTTNNPVQEIRFFQEVDHKQS